MMHVLKANKLYVARLGIGLLPLRHDQEINFGHMWLYWKSSEKEENPPYRGYYPSIEKIPSEYRDYRKWQRFFAHRCVQGECWIDYRAIRITTSFPAKIISKEWLITKEQLTLLRKRCFIPSGQDYKPEGYYSWNKRHPDWHNCSSWAISIINYVMNEPNFLFCSSPKRLDIVEQELWN